MFDCNALWSPLPPHSRQLCTTRRVPELLLPPVLLCLQMQLHRNGYIPSFMQRAKLLHQYLCSCVDLSVEPSEDIPTPGTATASGDGQTPALNPVGHSQADRQRAKARLQFELANPEERQQPQQEQLVAGDNSLGGCQAVYEFSRQSRPLTAAAAGDGAEQVDGEAAAEDTAGAVADAAAVAGVDLGQPQQQEQPPGAAEQVLGGRLLSVSQLWLSMPLSLALQVRTPFSMV